VVANDKFLSAICGLISEAGPCASEACECLAAVIGKKMPAGKKVQMLEQLQILRRLEACVHRSATDSQLLIHEAELLNSVGEVALEAYVDLRVQADAESATLAQAAWRFLESLMPFVFFSFSHQEYQIAGSVEPFLTEFFVKVKGFVADPKDLAANGPCHSVGLDQVRPILTQTLPLIIQRIAYPEWFQHHDPNFEDDERHIAFLEFRRSLTKIFKRIFLVDDQLGFQFVQASVAQLTQRLASVRPMEVDAVLYLYKEAGEIVKDVTQHLQAQGPLAGCFVQLVDCESLVKADHWAVQMGLMEIYVKYGRIFALHAELFARYGQRVLEAFVGSSGIRSTNPLVVTRACFMFGRFVKLAKKQINPLTVQIHSALQDLLVVQYIPSALLPVQADGSLTKVVIKGSLKVEDQACLYEALASLVAGAPPEEMQAPLQLLLQGPAGNLSDMLSGSSSSRAASDMPGFAGWAGRSIEAIATVSKAFTVQHACTALAWEEVMAVVARILEKFSSQLNREVGLWRAALFLCRRMVEVLGEQFLTTLDILLPFLYATNDQTDLAELSIFAHHVVCQYQRATQPLLQKWLHLIFLRPYVVWQQLPEGSEQLKREKLELGCALLQLLKEAAQRCPAALLEPMLLGAGTGARHGQEMTNFLLLGLQDPQELRSLLLAATTWGALFEGMATDPQCLAQLGALPLAQLLQRLLWSTVRMDYSDVVSQKVLAEASSILRTLTSPRVHSQGILQQTMEALQQALVGALPGLRSDLAPRRLCEALSQEAPLKDVRTALQQCAADWRRDAG